jgi:hypothetical protein
LSTLPPITSVLVQTVPLQAYLDRIAAIQAAAGGATPLPMVNFSLGALYVGDGNGSGAGPQVPSLSALVAAGGVTHQVWSGACVQSTSVDPSNAAQCDVLCVIPSVDSTGAEVGPFWVTEFCLTDENNTPMIVGTTLAPKFTSVNGSIIDLGLLIAIAYSSGTVEISAPTAPWMTQTQIDLWLGPLFSDLLRAIAQADQTILTLQGYALRHDAALDKQRRRIDAIATAINLTTIG